MSVSSNLYQTMATKRFVFSSEDDSSDLSEGEEKCSDSVVNSLPDSSSGPSLSPEELKFMKTFTYDKEPVKAWRQVSDYMAIKECNEVKWGEISDILGHFHGFSNSLQLYKNKSILVNLIQQILCDKNCYFFPEKCFLGHGYDFKDLLKKSLHNKFNPQFENLFKDNNSTSVELELEQNGRPKLFKLAVDIGFDTEIDYTDEGILKVDFSVFNEQFWKYERPCYVREEKKVLDVVHALLISSSKKQEEELAVAKKVYSKDSCVLNEPILKLMCFGPDLYTDSFANKNDACDITKDEKKFKLTNSNVQHENCSSFIREDHWKYSHMKDYLDTSKCEQKELIVLEGPASEKKSQEIYYPCNLGHCWLCCDCKFCRLTKLIECKNHKEHMKFNLRDCIIQQSAQCQEHWIYHPENFKIDEDIQVDKKIIFHNNQIQKYGRNYTYKSVRYSGLKLSCKRCKKNTNEHLNKHLTPHIQCKHCQYEMKTMANKLFWDKVCTICGKMFETKVLRNIHGRKHDFPEQECEICGQKCSTKFNLHRHMLEKHNSNIDNMTEDVENDFVCEVCNKSFKYLRNLKAHIYSFHNRQEEYQCKICDQKISTKSNLIRHLEEQHNAYDLDKSMQTKESCEIICTVCEKVFKRKENLDLHMKIHSSEGKKYCCDVCGKQFTSKFNLIQHQKSHTGDREKFECELCHKSFSVKGNFTRHMQGVHERKTHPCNLCDKVYYRSDKLNAHKNKDHS